MKYKTIALMLALTVMTWAQTSTQTAPSAPQQSTAPVDKAKAGCCDKMGSADAKEGHASCARMKAEGGKEMASCCAGKDAAASCCAGKDAKSCMKGDKGKMAGSCCGDKCGKDKTAAACCGGKDCEKGCCSSKTEKIAKSCCKHEVQS